MAFLYIDFPKRVNVTITSNHTFDLFLSIPAVQYACVNSLSSNRRNTFVFNGFSRLNVVSATLVYGNDPDKKQFPILFYYT